MMAFGQPPMTAPAGCRVAARRPRRPRLAAWARGYQRRGGRPLSPHVRHWATWAQMARIGQNAVGRAPMVAGRYDRPGLIGGRSAAVGLPVWYDSGTTFYDPEGSARTKWGKTFHGYGVQFLADLRFGLVWRFAVFPAGGGFRPQIADWVLETKKIFGWGPIELTSDREYTISKAIHHGHAGQVFHYGPRADIDRKDKGIFVEADFEIHEQYAICPNGAHLNRKPNVFVRGSSEQWRYQAKKGDCQECPRRGECTQGQNPRMLCINVFREDLGIHAARMQADPQRTRDLIGRHRAMSEGIVNNLMNHQGVRHACWKGLALARLQVGLAVLLLNTLKWHKIRHGRGNAGQGNIPITTAEFLCVRHLVPSPAVSINVCDVCIYVSQPPPTSQLRATAKLLPRLPLSDLFLANPGKSMQNPASCMAPHETPRLRRS